MPGPQLLTITAIEGTDVTTPIPFVANGVTVDNLSASWLFLTDAARFVPPFTSGYSTSLVAAGTTVRAQWQTPTGITTPVSGTGRATLTVATEALAFNPGVVTTQIQPTGTATGPSNVPPVTTFAQVAFNPLAVGATSTLVAAATGRTITVYTLWWKFAPTTTMTGLYIAGVADNTFAVDISGGFIQVYVATANPPPFGEALGLPTGLQLPKSSSLVVNNNAASPGGIALSCGVIYTQQ